MEKEILLPLLMCRHPHVVVVKLCRKKTFFACHIQAKTSGNEKSSQRNVKKYLFNVKIINYKPLWWWRGTCGGV